MNIRYFFIAGAVTSALTLAIQESDRITNKQPSPIVAPYTVDENILQLFEPTSATLGTLGALGASHILGTHNNSEARQRRIDDLCQQGKNLLSAIVGFLRSLIMCCIEQLFTENRG
ncbi:hypothetical protein V3564_05350 [Bartonella sp. B12(2025)]